MGLDMQVQKLGASYEDKEVTLCSVCMQRTRTSRADVMGCQMDQTVL